MITHDVFSGEILGLQAQANEHNKKVTERLRRMEVNYPIEECRMISIHFQGKLFIITVIQDYAPTSNTEKAEVEQFYEDLQTF